MPRDYEREYNAEAGDYKRKRRPVEDAESTISNIPGGTGIELNSTGHNDASALNEKAKEYLQECLLEQKGVENKYGVCKRLLDIEIERVLISGRIPKQEIYANVYSEKPIRVAQKVLFPIKEYPKFNFVGKILGPKGNTLRQLQEQTFCKMVVLGRNSMRDQDKEEDLRNSGNPKYAHLSRDLHIEISTVASPAEAYHRLAYALAEVRKYMIPDANDDIRLEQRREMDGKDKLYKKAYYAKQYTHASYSCRTPPPPTFHKSPKPKVYSILEKARYAMEDPTYGVVKSHRSRDSTLFDHHNQYHRYTTPPAPSSKHSDNHNFLYESGGTFERDYTREYHNHSSTYSNLYAEKATSGRSAYRPTTSGSHSSGTHFDSASRSRESVRYRSAPYQKMR